MTTLPLPPVQGRAPESRKTVYVNFITPKSIACLFTPWMEAVMSTRVGTRENPWTQAVFQVGDELKKTEYVQFLDSWLKGIRKYFVGLGEDKMQSRAFGLGNDWIVALGQAVDDPAWEHKLLLILTYITWSTQSRARLRLADQWFIEQKFRKHDLNWMWGRTAYDTFIGTGAGQERDTSRTVLRSFVQDQVHVYFYYGCDLDIPSAP
jgi:hypothetical protein